jgi:spore coat polysaccharide biosynthesis protein SpsF (cytidylyltransferase family)
MKLVGELGNSVWVRGSEILVFVRISQQIEELRATFVPRIGGRVPFADGAVIGEE